MDIHEPDKLAGAILPFIPLIPLASALLIGIAGKKLKTQVISIIGPGSVGLSFVLSLVALYLSGHLGEKGIRTSLFTWIYSGDFRVDFSFQLDSLSALMMLVVTGVGFLIHVYSVGYMHGDKGYARYFSYLNLFIFSMLCLVMGSNLVLLFLGWEGVGLCSYLLIGFWYEDPEKASAGKKAFIVNRIGDCGFLLGIFWLFSILRTVEFGEMKDVLGQHSVIIGQSATWICLLLFLGAVGKSAQIPLYVWLPDAMAGPTPVSALIHAATMVTAGVYMITRMSFLYVLSPVAMSVVAIVGALTALFSATIGLAQNDIKKVLAYSTVSQLGYMFLGAGVGAFSASMFHLTTHAFFKALLFMGAGSVIHALSGQQDITKMGGLRSKIPTTFWTFAVATLAISGIFPLCGFFSKDEIIWKAFSIPNDTLPWLPSALGIAALTGALLTAIYMLRLFYLTFLGESRLDHHAREHVHESPHVMTLPLVALAVLSIIGGFLGLPEYICAAGERFGLPAQLLPHNILHHVLEPSITLPETALRASGEAAAHAEMKGELFLGVASLCISLIAIIITWNLYSRRRQTLENLACSFGRILNVLKNKYWVDEIYDYLFVKSYLRASEWLWNMFDNFFIDGLVNGTAKSLIEFGSGLRRWATGNTQTYAFSLFAGALFIVGDLALR